MPSTIRPNILLIMSDQHSPSALGCAGDTVVRTPHLDQLAARGTRFSQAYCPSPLCVPSRMAFLTGRHCSDIQVWTNGCSLRSDIPTFVHHIVNAGYTAILCGRMHFIGPDQRHGFEQRIIGEVVGQLGHIPRCTVGQTADGVKIAGPGRTVYMAYDEDVTSACCQFLESWDRNPGDRPFFLTVGHILPHPPYICPKGLFEEYMQKVAVPRLPDAYQDSLHPAVKKWLKNRSVDELTPEQHRVARAAYFGLVTHYDELIGRILNTLSETRFAQDTVVIYCSDHGEMAGDHGMWWKSNFYQNSIRVPLIWSWPKSLAQGRLVEAPCSLLDIGPTLLDVIGAEPMNMVRGRSLLGFLVGDGNAKDWPGTVYAEYCGLEGDLPARMIRSGPWKLIHYHGYKDPQLFNLLSDPEEWNDLGQEATTEATRSELLTQVTNGWSAETVIDHSKRLMDFDIPVLQEYDRRSQTAKVISPEHWIPPENCNVFPE